MVDDDMYIGKAWIDSRGDEGWMGWMDQIKLTSILIYLINVLNDFLLMLYFIDMIYIII
jgi:hypothetical protein